MNELEFHRFDNGSEFVTGIGVRLPRHSSQRQDFAYRLNVFATDIHWLYA